MIVTKNKFLYVVLSGLVPHAACSRAGFESIELREDWDSDGTEGCHLALATLTSCLFVEGGTAQCVGNGVYGELGNGQLGVVSPTPVSVSRLEDVRVVRGGVWSFCAVTGDGTAHCWGRNETDRFGEAGSTHEAIPVPTTTLDRIVDIDLGARHGCVVRNDNTLWCWGNNDANQLGTPGIGSTLEPFLLDVGPVATFAASYSGSCALRTDGTVRCWGWLAAASSDTPKDMGIADVRQITAHGHTFYAVNGSNELWAWGSNDEGQLGIGTLDDSAVPVRVDLNGVVEVAAGGDHACALLDDGHVWCFGTNRSRGLGYDGGGMSTVPVRVDGLPFGVALAAGQEHACMIAVDGTIHCWGNSCCGQLGDGTLDNSATSPVLSQLRCSSG